MPKNRKRNRQEEEEIIMNQSWEEALGEMPPFGKTIEERRKWFLFQKRKWAYQRKQKKLLRRAGRRVQPSSSTGPTGTAKKCHTMSTIFILRYTGGNHIRKRGFPNKKLGISSL